MAIVLDKSRPICPQIEEFLCTKIANGEYKSGDKLISVRELAAMAVVNPNTVQKAYEGLEAKGLLHSVRGSGWFIGENPDKAKEIVNGIIEKETALYKKKMGELGLSEEEIINLIRSGDNE